MLDFLEQEHISRDILDGIRAYRARYPLPERLRPRVPHPHYHYYGREIWEAAAAALLCGRNLLLAGSKATGKNVLAENLSMAFDRPAWNVSVVDSFAEHHLAVHRNTRLRKAADLFQHISRKTIVKHPAAKLRIGGVNRNIDGPAP